MSDRVSEDRNPSPSTLALGQLRTLVHRLKDEAAGFRRRALQAEGRRQAREEGFAAEGAGDGDRPRIGELLARVEELERQNEELRRRLSEGAERTRQLLERTRFLRQQQEQEEEPQP